VQSLAEKLSQLDETERLSVLSQMKPESVRALKHDWKFWARPDQLPPPGDWVHWVPLAGRGWGKTRVGAETVRMWAQDPTAKIHIVGPTSSAVRSVMIEGPSGLLNCYPAESRPRYEPTRHLITFASGATAETFSADEPDRLRGPQCTNYWADEPAAWRFLDDAWDNLMFGLRLGNPRGISTTTPRPLKWLKDLIANPATISTRHSTYENRSNLAPSFFADIILKYEGTRLGRQELNAEILEDVPGALWTRALIDAGRVKSMADVRWDMLVRIVVAIDPAVSNNPDSDSTGIVVAGLTRGGHVVVLDDLTIQGSPIDWARVAVAAYRSRRADCIVGEVNNGGDLVGANIRSVDPNVNFRAVRASRGKYIRAEPVASLYEQGRVHHVGALTALEDQLCGWSPQSNDKSPDRLDALVWAVTELVIDQEQFERGFAISDVGQYQISSI
jgi:phage terminase large subunit-like protein